MKSHWDVGSYASSSKMSVQQVSLVAGVGARAGESVSVSRDLAMSMSELLSSMLCDGDDDEYLPLPNVSYEHLTAMVRFMEHYAVEPLGTIYKPVRYNDIRKIVSPWYADFVAEFSNSEIEALAASVNYVGIKEMMRLLATTIATWFHGKTPEEICQMRGLDYNDFLAKVDEIRAKHGAVIDAIIQPPQPAATTEAAATEAAEEE